MDILRTALLIIGVSLIAFAAALPRPELGWLGGAALAIYDVLASGARD